MREPFYPGDSKGSIRAADEWVECFLLKFGSLVCAVLGGRWAWPEVGQGFLLAMSWQFGTLFGWVGPYVLDFLAPRSFSSDASLLIR